MKNCGISRWDDPREINAKLKQAFTEKSERGAKVKEQNAEIKKLYDEFLGEYGGEKSHHLLHTSYVKRGLYV